MREYLKYLIAAVISVIVSALLTIFIWLISLGSWIFIGCILAILLIPVIKKELEIYAESECIDIIDYIEMRDILKENKKSNIKDL
jgi:hypothetical protein